MIRKILIHYLKEKKDFKEVAKYYENDFFNDLQSLGIQRASIVLRVTDYIPQILAFIDRLVERQLAYQSTVDKSVYFDSLAFKNSYFKFMANNPDRQEKQGNAKKHASDFSLWKSKKFDHEPSWPSRYGEGRPGWHIECSTLANIVFGSHLDFHSGGKDLLFPHHENEIKQCCAYNNLDTWSSHWLHSGHLHLTNSVKMSKSLKNTISIKELLDSYKQDEFRLFCLMSSYRYDKEFSTEIMIKPKQLLKSIQSFIEFTHAYSNGLLNKRINLSDEEIFKQLTKSRVLIHESLCDDFNTSLVVNELVHLMSVLNKSIVDDCVTTRYDTCVSTNYGAVAAVKQFIEYFMDIFGLNLIKNGNDFDNKDNFNIKSIIDSTVNFRFKMRDGIIKSKDIPIELKSEFLKYCDELRRDLNANKILIKDFKNNSTWSKHS